MTAIIVISVLLGGAYLIFKMGLFVDASFINNEWVQREKRPLQIYHSDLNIIHFIANWLFIMRRGQFYAFLVHYNYITITGF